MPDIASVAEFVTAMRRCNLPESGEWEPIAAAAPDAAALAQSLVRAGNLTQFQARQLLQGHGDELVLGPFLLLDRLGSGGMGQVFKARHQLMGRVVALKLIKPELLANPGAVARFQQEVQAAARLNHPNIIQAYHAEHTARGFFLAMEFCEGRDLAKVLEAGPLPIHQACDYTAQAAAGLSAAHAAGLVHRDIKPGNLLLTTTGVVKVLDFGLARLQSGEDKERLTRTGSAMGTPDFIAPEQAQDASAVDIRGDIYSLGCTLYFLLTGQVLYPGGTDWEKIIKHVSGTPTSVESLRAEVSPELAAIVRKMTARQPADRFQTPAEVEAALATFRVPASNPTMVLASPATAAGEPFAPPGTTVPTAAHIPQPTRNTAVRGLNAESGSPSQPFAIPESGSPSAPFVIPEAPETVEEVSAARTTREKPRPKQGAWKLWAGVGVALLAAIVVAVIAWPKDKPQSGDLAGHATPKDKETPKEKEPPKNPKGTNPEPPKAKWPREMPLIHTPDGVSSLQKSPMFRIAFHPKEPHILAIARGQYEQRSPGGVEIWDTKAGTRRVLLISDAEPSAFSVAFSADGALLACGSGALDTAISGASVAVFETKTWNPLQQFQTESDSVFALAFSPEDSRFLLVGTCTKTMTPPGIGGIELWDGGVDWKDKPVRRKRNTDHEHAVNGIVFDPSKRSEFLTAGWDGTVRRWNLTTEGAVQKGIDVTREGKPAIPEGTSTLLGLAMSGDGRWAAAIVNGGPKGGGNKRHLLVWDFKDDASKPALTFAASPDDVDFCSVAFLPDGSGIVTGDRMGHVRVWDLPGLKERTCRLRQSSPQFAGGMVWGLAFSPDDWYLVATGWDKDWVSRVVFIPKMDLEKK